MWIDIECPKCLYQDAVQLVDVKSEKIIFCNNCKVDVHLKDDSASVHSGVENINKAIQDLDNLLKNWGG
jgi:hypothetical protein